MEEFPGELDALRAENIRLRKLLRLTAEQARAAVPDQMSVSTPVTMGAAPQEKVAFYLNLFRCRSDIYALRWENPGQGRSGWVPAIRGQWRKGMPAAEASYLPLTADVVYRHLLGRHHIGLYPLADEDTCWWVAADFDKDTAMLDTLAYLKAGRAVDIPAALAQLRDEQQQALRTVAAADSALIVAPPGTGKTVIACAAIAARGVSALVIVDRKALADQWRARISEYLGVKCVAQGGPTAVRWRRAGSASGSAPAPHQFRLFR